MVIGVHDKHRQRLIARFLQEGLDGFAEHQILELLLFFGIVQKDTNPLAHVLIDNFGSVSGALDAPYEELLTIKGIGPNTAALLKLMPQLARVYQQGKQQEICLNSSEKSGQFLLPRYIGRTEETVFLVCLDSKCRVLGTTLLHRGSVNSAEVNVRAIVANALKHNAAGVILAHNHPGGIALPSEDDLRTTHTLHTALKPVGIQLIDHIIVADADFVSLADSGNLTPR